MVYILPLILILYGVYYYDYRRNESGRLVLLAVIAIVLIILGGLHYRVGFDSFAYERFYEKLRPLDVITSKNIEASRYAPGFVVLASFTKLFSPEPVLLYFIISGFVISCVTFFFIRNSKNPFFAFLIFYFFFFTVLIFEQIREAMAVGFFLLAWPAFKSNNWIKWYILSFCAIAFHTSATFMFILPMILLPGVRYIFIYGKRTWVFLSLVLIIAFILQHTFSRYIELLAVTQSMEELTQKYQYTTFIEGHLNIIGIITEFIRWILYPLLALIYFGKIKPGMEEAKGLIKTEMFVIISIYISILSLGVPILARFNNYFLFFPVILLSDLIFQKIIINRKRIRLKFVGWVLFFLPLFFLLRRHAVN